MKITLIGMSNTGKSYWSKKLEQSGFIRYSCDEIIEKKLTRDIEKAGFKGLDSMAKWLGQPYEKQFSESSGKYLASENESLSEIIGKLKYIHKEHDEVVIDTTGSVIYTDPNLLLSLKKLTTVVCLDTPKNVMKEMFEKYITNPKAVIWGDKFHKKQTESEFQALKRCYPGLLKFRNGAYRKYADVMMDYRLLRCPDFHTDDFLYEVVAQLKYDQIYKYQGKFAQI